MRKVFDRLHHHGKTAYKHAQKHHKKYLWGVAGFFGLFKLFSFLILSIASYTITSANMPATFFVEIPATTIDIQDGKYIMQFDLNGISTDNYSNIKNIRLHTNIDTKDESIDMDTLRNTTINTIGQTNEMQKLVIKIKNTEKNIRTIDTKNIAGIIQQITNGNNVVYFLPEKKINITNDNIFMEIEIENNGTDKQTENKYTKDGYEIIARDVDTQHEKTLIKKAKTLKHIELESHDKKIKVKIPKDTTLETETKDAFSGTVNQPQEIALDTITFNPKENAVYAFEVGDPNQSIFFTSDTGTQQNIDINVYVDSGIFTSGEQTLIYYSNDKLTRNILEKNIVQVDTGGLLYVNIKVNHMTAFVIGKDPFNFFIGDKDCKEVSDTDTNILTMYACIEGSLVKNIQWMKFSNISEEDANKQEPISFQNGYARDLSFGLDPKAPIEGKKNIYAQYSYDGETYTTVIDNINILAGYEPVEKTIDTKTDTTLIQNAMTIKNIELLGESRSISVKIPQDTLLLTDKDVAYEGVINQPQEVALNKINFKEAEIPAYAFEVGNPNKAIFFEDKNNVQQNIDIKVYVDTGSLSGTFTSGQQTVIYYSNDQITRSILNSNTIQKDAEGRLYVNIQVDHMTTFIITIKEVDYNANFFMSKDNSCTQEALTTTDKALGMYTCLGGSVDTTIITAMKFSNISAADLDKTARTPFKNNEVRTLPTKTLGPTTIYAQYKYMDGKTEYTTAVQSHTVTITTPSNFSFFLSDNSECGGKAITETTSDGLNLYLCTQGDVIADTTFIKTSTTSEKDLLDKQAWGTFSSISPLNLPLTSEGKITLYTEYKYEDIDKVEYRSEIVPVDIIIGKINVGATDIGGGQTIKAGNTLDTTNKYSIIKSDLGDQVVLNSANTTSAITVGALGGDWNGIILPPEKITAGDARQAVAGEEGIPIGVVPKETILVGADGVSLTLDNNINFNISYQITDPTLPTNGPIDVYYSNDGSTWQLLANQGNIVNNLLTFNSSHLTLFTIGTAGTTTTWNNLEFITPRFRAAGPTSGQIIDAFYGTGGNPSAYTTHRNGSCRPTSLITRNPQTSGAITLAANTIYVLNSGNYIQTDAITFGGNCIAIVGSGTVNIFKSGAVSMFSATTKTGIIIDNLELNGNGQASSNIYFVTSQSSTINDVQAYNGSFGIQLNTSSKILINNSQAFKNGSVGMYILGAGSGNIINNSQSYNNGYGFYVTTTTGTAINNSQAYNSSNYGIYVNAPRTVINNVQVYNNTWGIYLTTAPNTVINNSRIFKNTNTNQVNVTNATSSGRYYGNNIAYPTPGFAYLITGNYNPTLGRTTGSINTTNNGFNGFSCDFLASPFNGYNTGFYTTSDCSNISTIPARSPQPIVKYLYGNNMLSGYYTPRQIQPVLQGLVLSSIPYHGHRFIGEYEDSSDRDINIPVNLFSGETPTQGYNIMNTGFFTVRSYIYEPNLTFAQRYEQAPSASIEYNTVYETGLVLMYNFDNIKQIGDTGTLIQDVSLYHNYGTTIGSVVWTGNGYRNGGYSFFGANNSVIGFIEIPHSDSLAFTGAYTLAAWIKPNTIVQYEPIFVRGSGTVDDIEVYIQNTSFFVINHNRANGGTIGGISTSLPTANQWTQLVVTYSGINATSGNVKLYYSGVYITGAVIAAPLDTHKRWMIGGVQAFSPGYFKGSIDEPRMRNRALSDTEITHLYNSNLSSKDDHREYVVNYTGVNSTWPNGMYKYGWKTITSGYPEGLIDINGAGIVSTGYVQKYMNCSSGFSINWNNNYYLTGGFWNQNPNDCDIIYALFGTGTSGTDTTEYTETRTGGTGVCTYQNMAVVHLTGGTDKIPLTLTPFTIYALASGTYIQSNLITMKNCTAIIGKTGDIKMYSNTGGLTSMVYIYSIENAIVDNVQIDGESNGIGGTHTGNIAGILVSKGSDYSTINKATVKYIRGIGGTTHGIYINGAVNTKISNNEIYNNTNGIREGGTKTIIENSNIYNNTTLGIRISKGTGAIYSGLHIYGNTGALYFQSGRNITVTNLQAYNNTAVGIYFGIDNKDITLNNIQTYSSSGAGIHFVLGNSYITFNNVQSYNNDYGLRMENDATDRAMIAINNSQFYNNSGDGILLYKSAYTTINNTHIYNNSGDGIHFAGADNATGILNNVFSYNNGGYGIYSQGGNHYFYSNLTVFKNTDGNYYAIPGGSISAGNGSTYAYIGRTAGSPNISPCMSCSRTTNMYNNLSLRLIDTNIYPKCDKKGQNLTRATTGDLTYKYGINLTGQKLPVTRNVSTLTGSSLSYNGSQYVAETNSASTDYTSTQCSCLSHTYTWNNNNFLDSGFWNSGAVNTDYCEIIAALYGTGINGSDQTAYTNYRGSGVGRSGQCNVENTDVIFLTGGTGKIPYNMNENIIYVLASGNYIQTDTIRPNTCNSILGKTGNIVLYSTGELTDGMIHSNISYNIFDNLKIDGIGSGVVATHNGNGFGIYIGGSVNHINKVQAYNNGNGIRIDTAGVNVISNSQIYNNGDGIFVYLGYYNIINNSQAYNNGIGILISSSNGNAVNNSQSYNNNGDGIDISYSSSQNIINNSQSYNNNGNGIRIFQAAHNADINNTRSYNNNGYGIFVNNSSNTTYYGTGVLFNNELGNTGGNSNLTQGTTTYTSTLGRTTGNLITTGTMSWDYITLPLNYSSIFMLSLTGYAWTGIIGQQTFTPTPLMKYSYGSGVLTQIQPVYNNSISTKTGGIYSGTNFIGSDTKKITGDLLLPGTATISSGITVTGISNYTSLVSRYGIRGNIVTQYAQIPINTSTGIILDSTIFGIKKLFVILYTGSDSFGYHSYFAMHFQKDVQLNFIVDCMTGWNNDNFLNSTFWNNVPAPTTGNIICAIYGSGGNDRTAYTTGWSGYSYSSCLSPGMTIDRTGIPLSNTLNANTIYVLTTGTYTRYTDITMSTCSAIVGSGTVTLIPNSCSNDPACGNSFTNGHIFIPSKQFAVVDNIRLNAAWVFDNGVDPVENNYNSFGILADNSSNNTFNKVETYQGNDGIVLYNGSNYNLIHNSKSYDNHNFGMAASTNSSYNTFSGIQAYNNLYDGILIYTNSNYNTLNNIIAYGHTHYGIDISAGSNYNTVTSGQTYNNSYCGIITNAANYNTLSGIQSYSNYCGIHIYNSDYNTGNNLKVYNNTARGVQIETTSDYNTISNAQLYKNGRGGIIMLDGSTHNTLSNSQIYNNVYEGMYIESGSNYNIINNTQAFNNYRGLLIYNTSNYNTVNNSQFYNNGEGGGIWIENNTNTIINNSQIYNNAGYGILSAGTNGAINNVQSYNNLSRGIYNYSSSNNYFGVNNIFNNRDGSIGNTSLTQGTSSPIGRSNGSIITTSTISFNHMSNQVSLSLQMIPSTAPRGRPYLNFARAGFQWTGTPPLTGSYGGQTILQIQPVRYTGTNTLQTRGTNGTDRNTTKFIGSNVVFMSGTFSITGNLMNVARTITSGANITGSILSATTGQYGFFGDITQTPNGNINANQTISTGLTLSGADGRKNILVRLGTGTDKSTHYGLQVYLDRVFPGLIFTGSTPINGGAVNVFTGQIQLTETGIGLDIFRRTRNTINYPIYDSGLVLMMNFDTGFLLGDSQAEFSTTQGANNWYYYRSPSDNAYNELIYDASNSQRDVVARSRPNYYEYLLLSSNGVLPGVKVAGNRYGVDYGDAVRARRSPVNAKINIVSSLNDTWDTNTNSDGITYKIIKGVTTLFSSGYANNFAATDINISTTVNKGDMIYFVTNMSGNNGRDGTINTIKIYQSPETDLSQYGNHGTGMNGLTRTSSGKWNGGYSFDGINDYINVPDAASLRLSNNTTWGAWLNANDHASYQEALWKEGGYLIRLESSNYYSCWRYSNTDTWQPVYSTTPISTGTWHHVMCTRDSNNLKMYIDGAYNNSASPGNNYLWLGSDRMEIGAARTYAYRSGKIDEVRVYQRVLSSGEILQQYKSNLAKYDIGKWLFTNTQTGNGTFGYTGYACDLASNCTTTGRSITIDSTECKTGWDNNNFLTGAFWSGTVTDRHIICALYGSGGTDQTAYTQIWSGYTSGSCLNQGMTVIPVLPGIGTIPQNLNANTIYVLSSGNYIITGDININTCSAVVGKTGNISFFASVALTRGIFTFSGDSYSITDNVTTNLSGQGYDCFYFTTSPYNTINNISCPNSNGTAIEIRYSNYNLLNNIKVYKGGNYGMYIGNSSSYNVVNNFQLYDNSNSRRALYITSPYNTFNNGLMYNNGINIRVSSDSNTFNNIQIFNNKDSSLFVQSPVSGQIFNNISIYNNTGTISYGLGLGIGTNKYYGSFNVFSQYGSANTGSLIAGSINDSGKPSTWGTGQYSPSNTVSRNWITNPVYGITNYLSSRGSGFTGMIGYFSTWLGTPPVQYSYAGDHTFTQVQPVQYVGTGVQFYGFTGSDWNTGKFVGGTVNRISGSISISPISYTTTPTVTLTSATTADYRIFGDIDTEIIGTIVANVSEGITVTLSPGLGTKNIFVQFSTGEDFATHYMTSTEYLYCLSGWNNDNFIDDTFWTQSPTSNNIICALYGSGGTDQTAYTSGRQATPYDYSYCDNPMTVEYRSSIPTTINSYTIYVIESGDYQINDMIHMSTCSTIISSGTVNILPQSNAYFDFQNGPFNIIDNITYDSLGTYSQYGLVLQTNENTVHNMRIYGTTDVGIYGAGVISYNLFDTITINGSTNYGMFFKGGTWNTINNCNIHNTINNDGIGLASSADYNLINNTSSYNNSNGIRIESSNYNTINNISTYNNRDAGISIGFPSYNTVINNSQSYNNASYGIVDRGTYTTINNSSIYNNTSHGIYNVDGGYNVINNVDTFNNGGAGLVGENDNGIIANVRMYNNADCGYNRGNYVTYYGDIHAINNGNGNFCGPNFTQGVSTDYPGYGWNDGMLYDDGTNYTVSSMTGFRDYFMNPINTNGDYLLARDPIYTNIWGQQAGYVGTITDRYSYGSGILLQSQPVLWTTSPNLITGFTFDTTQYIGSNVPRYTGDLLLPAISYTTGQIVTGQASTSEISGYNIYGTDLINTYLGTPINTSTGIFFNVGDGPKSVITQIYSPIYFATHFEKFTTLNADIDCARRWDNTNFITGAFWTTSTPSDENIICALYGSNTDTETAYTQLWSGRNGTQCSGTAIHVVYTGNLSISTLDSNTIYVVTGTIDTGNAATINMANCSTVISNQTTGTTFYSTAQIGSMFYGNSKSYFILDNLSIDGYNNGAGGTHTRNTIGIRGNSSNNFTINTIQLYNHNNGAWDNGLQLTYTKNSLINNIQAFNNNNWGILIGSNVQQNTISNSQIFNNTQAGIYISNESGYNAINNTQIYNNGGFGIVTMMDEGDTINNTQIYNNKGGISYYYATGGIINNCMIYNNLGFGIDGGAGATFYGTNYFANNSLGNFQRGTPALGSSSDPKVTGLGWSNGSINTSLVMSRDYITNPMTTSNNYLVPWTGTWSGIISQQVGFTLALPLKYSYGTGTLTQIQPIYYSGTTLKTGEPFNSTNYIGSDLTKITGDLLGISSISAGSLIVTGISNSTLVNKYSVFGDIINYKIGQTKATSTGITLLTGLSTNRIVTQLWYNPTGYFATHFQKNTLLDTVAPSQVILISPLSGTITVNSTVPLVRSAAIDTGIGMGTYVYQVSTGVGFTTFITSGTTSSTGVTLNSLAVNTYYWRVYAIDLAGNTGAWSETWQFMVDIPISCLGTWDNNNFITGGFRALNPSDSNIICALYGSGGSDWTAYTQYRSGYGQTSCLNSGMLVVHVNPGTGMINLNMAPNTIYVLSSGAYIQTGNTNFNVCNAVIGSTGKSIMYSNQLISGVFLMYTNSDKYNIIDNLNIDGTGDGWGGSHTANMYDVMIGYSSNNTINNIRAYNTDRFLGGRGIYVLDGDNNLINNSELYYNYAGIAIGGTNNRINNNKVYNNNYYGLNSSAGSYNIINNSQFYNNGYYGIDINNGITNRTLNNVQAYNNGVTSNGFGIYIDGSGCILNNVQTYNNNVGLYLSNSTYNTIFNNVQSYHNRNRGLRSNLGIPNITYYGATKFFDNFTDNIFGGGMLIQGTGTYFSSLGRTTGSLIDTTGLISRDYFTNPINTNGDHMLSWNWEFLSGTYVGLRFQQDAYETTITNKYSYGSGILTQIQPVLWSGSNIIASGTFDATKYIGSTDTVKLTGDATIFGNTITGSSINGLITKYNVFGDITPYKTGQTINTSTGITYITGLSTNRIVTQLYDTTNYFATHFQKNINLTACTLQRTGTTPTAGATLTGNNFKPQLNISNCSVGINTFNYTFNGTTYPYYDSGLVLMMNFDNIISLGETTGIIVKDRSVIATNGTGTSSPTRTGNGRWNGTYSFNGSTQFISTPTRTLGTNTTFAARGKSNSYNTGMLRNQPSPTYPSYYDLLFGYNQIYLNVGDGRANVFSGGGANVPQPSTGEWHYFVVVLDATANKTLLYIDGAYAGQALYRNPTNNTAGTLSIGGAVGYRRNGEIDEFRIRNRALTSGQILQMRRSNLNKYDTGNWLFTDDRQCVVDNTYIYTGYVLNTWQLSSITGRTNIVNINNPYVTAPTGYYIGSTGVSSNIETLSGQFTGYFKIEDREGTTGWYTTITLPLSLTGVTYTNNHITNNGSNIKFMATGAIYTEPGGTNSGAVYIYTGIQNYTGFLGSIHYMKRNTGRTGYSCPAGVYGNKPYIKVDIPAYQNPDTYSGMITIDFNAP